MKFDYIIIGAGSAGCVLANRLTESGKDSIGIFEAGKSSDYGFSLNFNPILSGGNHEVVGDLQFVLGTNYEENKFLNSTSSGVFATGDMSSTNFTGLKYKKNISEYQLYNVFISMGK